MSFGSITIRALFCCVLVVLVVWPTPASAQQPRRLTISYRDASTGDPIAVRAGVIDDSGMPRIPPAMADRMYQARGSQSYFYTDTTTTIVLFSDDYTIHAGKGFEYEPAAIPVTVQSDTAIVLELARFVDMKALGWRSGDTHVHITHPPVNYDLGPEHVALFAEAEDLHLVNSMEDESFFSGDIHPLSTPDRLIFFGKEERNADFSHLSLLGLREWIPDTDCPEEAMACGFVLDSAIRRTVHRRSPDAVVIATHPFSTFDVGDVMPWPGGGMWRAMPIDLVTGAVDAMDLLGYTTASPPQGIDPYFHALNCGFRLPPSAGTDTGLASGASLPPGGYRVYVRIPDGEPFTMGAWMEGLRAGRSFVTNYPLIESFELDGAVPGDVLRHNGHVLRGALTVSCIAPFDAVEIIGNGRVLETMVPEGGASRFFEGEFTVDPTGIDWLVVRVTGPLDTWHVIPANGLFALSAPIYLERANASAERRGQREIKPVSSLGGLAQVPTERKAGAEYFHDFLFELERVFEEKGYFAGDSEAEFRAALARSKAYFAPLAADPPEAFSLISPCLGPQGTTPPGVGGPLFRWSRARDRDPGGTVSYVFRLSTHPTFPHGSFVRVLTDTTYLLDPWQLPVRGARYYWRVEAVDELGQVRTSTPVSCEFIFDLTVIGINRDTPVTTWDIRRIAPNPFHTDVRVTYAVPEDGGDVRVAVYDVAGRHVRTLFSGHRQRGIFSVAWDGRNTRGVNVASGIYFVRLAPARGHAVVRRAVMLR